MKDLHFGYDRNTQDGLWAILGERHWASDLNVSTAIPYADMPGEHGNVVTRPVDRRAVIIEGDKDVILELLGDDFPARLEKIQKRLKKAGK